MSAFRSAPPYPAVLAASSDAALGNVGVTVTYSRPVLGDAAPSAASLPALAKEIQAGKVDTLVITGLTTECCVQSSVWAAFERKFHIFIAADACAAYEYDQHQVALKAMALSGANLTTTADIRAAWKV